MAEEKSQAANPFGAAIADARAEIASPKLSPQGCLDATLAIEWNVHPSKYGQAVQFVAEFRKAAVDALRHFDYPGVQRIIEKFHRDMRFSGLSASVVPEDPNRKEAVTNWLRPHGWSSAEIECAIQQLRASGGGTITAADFESVTIGGRVHSRERLRLWAKPQYAADNPWFDESAWAAQWPEIKRPAEQEEEKPPVDGLPAGWRYDPKQGRAVRVGSV